MKLFDWIKGAVAFTKAPAGPGTAQTPEPPAPPPRIDVPAAAPPEPQLVHDREAARVIEPLAHTDADNAPVGVEPPAPMIEPEAAINVAAEPAIRVEPTVRISAEASGVPTQDEIDRRRGLVRKFFNDYWSSVDDKPASFAERLDGAEGYINERVAAGGEPWQLDPATRKQLGLPPSRKR